MVFTVTGGLHSQYEPTKWQRCDIEGLAKENGDASVSRKYMRRRSEWHLVPQALRPSTFFPGRRPLNRYARGRELAQTS